MATMPEEHGEAPGWADRLRTAGVLAWSLVGVALLVVVLGLLFLVLRPVVLALLVALFLAIVFVPVVDALARRGAPRALGAATALVTVIVVSIGAYLLVVWGIASEQESISQSVSAAVDRLDRTLASAGVSDKGAEAAHQSVRNSAGTLLSGLLPALGNVLGGVVNLVVGVVVALFTCFFLLRDSHSMSERVAGWIPVQGHLGRSLLDEAATTIRRYFVGLTALGVVNAVGVAVGAVILGVPLVATLAVVTLLGSYIPYLGALVAGAFAVLIALGAGGLSTALWMLVVVLIANGLLQYLVSPFTYGVALNLSPLVVLLSAIVGGALAGVAGVTLATPLTAVVVNSVRLIRKASQATDADQPASTGTAEGRTGEPLP